MLTKIGRSAAAVVIAAAAVTAAWGFTSAPANADPVQCGPGEQLVTLPKGITVCQVKIGNTPPPPGPTSSGPGGGGGVIQCMWNGVTVVPCQYPGQPDYYWDALVNCWVGPPLDLPPDRAPATGWEYWLQCPQPDWTPTNDHIGVTTINLPNPPPGKPDPTKLAQQAEAELVLRPPTITMAPMNGGSGLVGMPVWLSIATTNNQYWGQQTTPPVSVPGLSVTATAKTKSVTWDMGDGHTVPCLNPGTPYSASDGLTASPDCPYIYRQPSGSKPGGVYTVTATTTWEVTWSASTGQSGTLPDQTLTSTTTIKIGELQAVN